MDVTMLPDGSEEITRPVELDAMLSEFKAAREVLALWRALDGETILATADEMDDVRSLLAHQGVSIWSYACSSSCRRIIPPTPSYHT